MLERIGYWKLKVLGPVRNRGKKVGSIVSSSFATQTVRDEVKKEEYCELEIE